MFNYIEWYKHKGIYEQVLNNMEDTKPINMQVSSLFLWDRTPEGNNYWATLSREQNRDKVKGWKPYIIYLGGE